MRSHPVRPALPSSEATGPKGPAAHVAPPDGEVHWEAVSPDELQRLAGRMLSEGLPASARGRVAFCAGLPQSGTNLLLSLLAQRPDVRCAPDSGLASLVEQVLKAWRVLPAFRAEGLARVKPRIRQAIWGLVEGYYAGAQAPLAIDQQWSWPFLLVPMMRGERDRQPRVVLAVRDLRDVLVGFERHYQQRDVDDEVRSPAFHLDPGERANALLDPSGALGSAIAATRVALRELPLEQLVVVPYDDFRRRPREVLAGVEQRLGLQPFAFEIDSAPPESAADDVRRVGPLQRLGDRGIPEELSRELEVRYPDIQALSRMTLEQANDTAAH